MARVAFGAEVERAERASTCRALLLPELSLPSRAHLAKIELLLLLLWEGQTQFIPLRNRGDSEQHQTLHFANRRHVVKRYPPGA